MNIIKSFKKFFIKSPFPDKKVLVLEGGGMRGIFLTGILQTFTDRGYFPWELIIGSSAGALTGTVYAAGQIYMARDAFFTKLLSGDFINLWNILNNKKHVLNLDWMVDTIIKGDEPLDLKKLKKSCPVIITATNCTPYNSPTTIYLNSKKDNIDTALKATAAIPVLYRGFVKYQEYNFLDGALLDPVPYKKALELGYKETDIVVILTRSRGYVKKAESRWVRMLYESYYKEPSYKYLVLEMENRYEKYNRMIYELENVYKGIQIIYPPAEFNINRLSQDGEKILHGFEHGIQAGKKYLKGIDS